MAVKQLYPNQRPTLNLNFARSKTLDPRITFSRGNCEGTYVGSDGLIKTAAVDEPRFDHDPVTGDCRGLLIEESRTNYIQNSIDFNAGDWSFNSNGTSPGPPVCTPNSGTAPDGTNTATRLVCDHGGGTTFTDLCHLRCNRDSNSRQVVSIWVKSNTGSDQTIYMTLGTGGSVIVTNTWKRYLGLSSDYRIGARGDRSDQNVDVLIWGAQVEDGDNSTGFHTSYIPTSGSTCTRNADVVSMTASPYLYGTFVAEYKHIVPKTVQNRHIFAVGNANGFHVFEARSIYNSSLDSNLVQLGMPQIADILGVLTETDGFNTVAVVRIVGDYAACVNGGSVATSSITSDQTNNSVITFKYGRNGNDSSGYMSRLSYYPYRLTDSQLQELTR